MFDRQVCGNDATRTIIVILFDFFFVFQPAKKKKVEEE